MGFSYSSDKFYRDWRFAIEQDFVNSSGGPFEYAKHGLKQWGQEEFAVPFPKDGKAHLKKCAAISDDGSYLAISAEFDVDVFDIKDFKHAYTLKGHVSQIDCIAFRPGSSNELVTAAMNDYGGSRKADPEIIFWNLKTFVPNILASPEMIERMCRNAANSVVADVKLITGGSKLSASDQKALAEVVKEPITHFMTAKGVEHAPKIFGRILGSFQSQVFSPSGKTMIYLPGCRPMSNGDDDWEIRTYSVDEKKDMTIFSGHRDSVVWAEFNHDETLLGTASWDGTFRIWDASNGETKYKFSTGLQNWTGGFSPDGKYFAGTAGDGTLHIYDLADGTEYMTYKHGNAWTRELAWHPDSQLLALGTEDRGKLILLDISSKQPIQERVLSLRDTKVPEERKSNLKSFLGVYRVAFVDGGKKLAFYTSGDGSAEVYDLEKEVKWRFARTGTMNPPEDDSKVTSKGGFDMLINEHHASKKITIASVDDDQVRIWSVPKSS